MPGRGTFSRALVEYDTCHVGRVKKEQSNCEGLRIEAVEEA